MDQESQAPAWLSCFPGSGKYAPTRPETPVFIDSQPFQAYLYTVNGRNKVAPGNRRRACDMSTTALP
jgi:hypothetical protein